MKWNGEVCWKNAVLALLVDGECFYTLYPYQSTTKQLPNRLEYFENLVQYCGLSFKQIGNVDDLISLVH